VTWIFIYLSPKNTTHLKPTSKKDEAKDERAQKTIDQITFEKHITCR
jgi:hypothetical protein